MKSNRKRWQVIGVLAFFLAMLPSLVQAGPLAQTRPREQVYIPMIAAYDVAATAAPALVTGDKVYGLLGRLEARPAGQHEYYLATQVGTYALAGYSPDIEAQFSTLDANDGVRLKVWGEIVESRTDDAPLIVVTGMMIVGPEATPVPVQAASVPIAIVKFDRVNLSPFPRANSGIVGSVTLDQACNIVGRNVESTWWVLSCADGQRGWIDGRLVQVQGSTANVEIVTSAQPEQVVSPPESAPTPTPVVPTVFSGWRTEFYANMSLSGSPQLIADASAIDFSWGQGAPANGLPVDGFSARFTRTFDFTPAFYEIRVRADDGVRLWLDNELIIDEWRGATNEVFTVGRVLNGRHNIRVEYYEASGAALLQVEIATLNEDTAWRAAYYPGVEPEGAPLITRGETRGQNPLEHDWGSGSPATDLLGRDFWSARWIGTFSFSSGNYVFRVEADDGVRVYLDGLLVIDQWRDGYKERDNRVLGVGSGDHQVTVEYYERSGSASVKVWWYRDSAYTGPQ